MHLLVQGSVLIHKPNASLDKLNVKANNMAPNERAAFVLGSGCGTVIECVEANHLLNQQKIRCSYELLTIVNRLFAHP